MVSSHQSITNNIISAWQIINPWCSISQQIQWFLANRSKRKNISPPYFPARNWLQAATGWVPSHHRKPARDPIGSMRSHSPDGCGHRGAWPISRNHLYDAKFLARSGRCSRFWLSVSDLWKKRTSDRLMSNETQDRKKRITVPINCYWR